MFGGSNSTAVSNKNLDYRFRYNALLKINDLLNFTKFDYFDGHRITELEAIHSCYSVIKSKLLSTIQFNHIFSF